MSFSKFKIGELRQIAESFGVEIPAKTTKEGIILLFEEEGISYDMYEKFSGAEKEDIEDDSLPAPSLEVTQNSILVKMDRRNPSYQVGRYTFTQQHPFMVMTEDDAQRIFDTESGFRVATPREAQEYYS